MLDDTELKEAPILSELGDGDSDTVVTGDDGDGDTKPLPNPPQKATGLVKQVVDRLRPSPPVDVLMGKEQSGFKTFDGADGKARWIGWYSNAFEDKDGEWFPARATDAYVARVDMGLVPYPELWLDHVPGSKAGKADWIGRIGLISVAVGTFDDTEIGRKAHAYFSASREPRRMSHGFEYDLKRKIENAFWVYNTFEVSTLPIGKEANPFTSFGGVKAMPIAEWKEEDLKVILGDDLAQRVLQQTEAHSKALVAKNVAWKEFTDPNPADPALAVSQKAVDTASADLKAWLPDLLETQTEVLNDQATLATALKQHRDLIVELTAQVKEAREWMQSVKQDLPRRPSTDVKTILDDIDVPKHMKNAMSTIDPQAERVFGGLVSE